MKRVILNILAFLAALGMCAAALLVWLGWSNRNFTESFYSLHSPDISGSVRAVLLADLHQAEFGEDNRQLITRISQLKPDLILIAGDTVTAGSADVDYAVKLCGQLVEIAPVYFGLGNHENAVIYGEDLNISFLEQSGSLLGDDPEDFTPLIRNAALLEELEKVGVTVLQNSSAEVEVNGNRIEIGGISTNLSSFWPYSGQFITRFCQENGAFKLLICHRPDVVMRYIPDYPIDLVVSGHNHGGVVRIPGKGGVFSADGGLFPVYDAGVFQSGEMTMVVSRGLGGHGLIPRVFNQPELVVIDLS